MLWLEICLYSRGGNTGVGAGFEDRVSQRDCDYSHDSENEKGEELSL